MLSGDSFVTAKAHLGVEPVTRIAQPRAIIASAVLEFSLEAAADEIAGDIVLI
jgi:hypothetical protein